MNRSVGIDLGTSNCCLATVLNGEPTVLENENGKPVTPSVLSLNRKGVFIVGHLPKAQQLTNPKETIYSIKRLMGCKLNDKNVEMARQSLSYPIVEGKNGMAAVCLENNVFSPEEICAQLLKEMMQITNYRLKQKTDKAVITVPAHFNDAQRRSTLEAAKMAGYTVLRLINEPTAAALAYGQANSSRRYLAVYDFGGGTFDISILKADGDIFEVVSTCGDSYLGGDDINWRLVEHLASEFRSIHQIDLKTDKIALQRLLAAAEMAKIDLSHRLETSVNLPSIIPSVAPELDLKLKLTRGQLEAISRDLVGRTFTICELAFKALKLNPHQIDEVVLVGGQTRMPMVQNQVANYFGRAPKADINPEEVVALGAALHANALLGEGNMLLLDVTPLTLGIASLGNRMHPIIPKNTKVPYRATKRFTTSQDGQTRVRILVFQGEERSSSDNTFLGEFVLEGIPPAPRMKPSIDVTFRVDSNAILHVSAKDADTGQSQSITIQNLVNPKDMNVKAHLLKEEAMRENPGS